MDRVLEREWLDDLPPDDPGARRSRRDLQRLNGLMGHARLFARQLRSNPSIKRWCDLGSGDGALLLRIAERLRWRDVHLTMIDRQPAMSLDTAARFAAIGWRVNVITGDVRQALAQPQRFDVMTANLFLHHFPTDALRELLARASASTRLFVAIEPRRSRRALLASKCVGAVGCGPVTRHDAIASVRAGFAHRELTSHWPASPRWQTFEHRAGLFSHVFVAQRG